MRFLLPALVLLGLLVLLGVGLTLDPRKVPSPLIDKPAPAFELPALKGEGTVRHDDLLGAPTLVNYFASWCTPCLVEHPLLMRLARERRIRLVGINYKDPPEEALRWLARHGDPYAVIARDSEGAAGLDWGVYGVPETYLLDARGILRYKHVGPLTEDIWEAEFAPRLAALAEAGP
jgi:cytochrome c biogenesis protein CcmG/thiol:disulfide interchange protein DsbE